MSSTQTLRPPRVPGSPRVVDPTVAFNADAARTAKASHAEAARLLAELNLKNRAQDSLLYVANFPDIRQRAAWEINELRLSNKRLGDPHHLRAVNQFVARDKTQELRALDATDWLATSAAAARYIDAAKNKKAWEEWVDVDNIEERRDDAHGQTEAARQLDSQARSIRDTKVEVRWVRAIVVCTVAAAIGVPFVVPFWASAVAFNYFNQRSNLDVKARTAERNAQRNRREAAINTKVADQMEAQLEPATNEMDAAERQLDNALKRGVPFFVQDGQTTTDAVLSALTSKRVAAEDTLLDVYAPVVDAVYSHFRHNGQLSVLNGGSPASDDMADFIKLDMTDKLITDPDILRKWSDAGFDEATARRFMSDIRAFNSDTIVPEYDGAQPDPMVTVSPDAFNRRQGGLNFGGLV